MRTSKFPTSIATTTTTATRTTIESIVTRRRKPRIQQSYIVIFRRLVVMALLSIAAMSSSSFTSSLLRRRFGWSAFPSPSFCSAFSVMSMSMTTNQNRNMGIQSHHNKDVKRGGKNLPKKHIAVIGGGASGIFAALAATERMTTTTPKRNPIQVTVYEATSQTLHKVKISGGGRCNVLHDTSKSTSTLLEGYPRGKKELQGLFLKHFTPTMARTWFEQRGVTLKTEEDGRMFPVTDNSQTIIDTLLHTAERQGVDIHTNEKVASITANPTSTGGDEDDEEEKKDGTFVIELKDGSQHMCDAIILATGSAPSGYALAQQLELPLDPRVPSLFTLNTKSEIKEGGLLYGLSGVSVPQAQVTLPLVDVPTPVSPVSSSSSSPSSSGSGEVKTKNNKPKKKKYPTQSGPLLITHHGLSGPAVLRLSAFAAHEFKDRNYRGQLLVNWDTKLGDNIESVLEDLWKVTSTNPKRTVASMCPLPNHSIPRRLWSALVSHSGFEVDTIWGNASKKLVRQLATNLIACSIEVTGKGTFKDEFVTAGGVSLKYIDMKRMESKIHPGLFVCGELLNVDGVTGGFNFMNCWSTGYVAGHSAVDHCLKDTPTTTTATTAARGDVAGGRAAAFNHLSSMRRGS